MRVIVVGGGKVGAHLAEMLLAGRHDVHVIETRREQLPPLERDLPPGTALHGSGTDPTLLEAAGARAAQVLAAVTGADEVNLIAASLARFEFNVPRVIARVNNPKNAWLFTPALGVDVALNQSDLMAHLIAEEMSLGDMMTLLKLRRGQYALVEERVHPRAAAAGKAVRDLALPAACVLTAVIRHGVLVVPRGDTVLEADDEVLALVHSDHTHALAALLGVASTGS